MRRCLPLFLKEPVGRQSYVVPGSENQFQWISNDLFSGSETDESRAPFPASSVYCIQRIMVMAQHFSHGLKALWPTLAHFPPRNQQELPETNTALLLAPILREEVYLSVLSSFGTLRGSGRGTHSAPPFLFLASFPAQTPHQNCTVPHHGQMPVGLKSELTHCPRGRPLFPPPPHLSSEINLTAEEN